MKNILAYMFIFISYSYSYSQKKTTFLQDSIDRFVSIREFIQQEKEYKAFPHILSFVKFNEGCISNLNQAIEMNAEGKVFQPSNMITKKCLSCLKFYRSDLHNDVKALEVLIDNSYSVGDIEKAKDYLLLLRYSSPYYEYSKGTYGSVNELFQEHRYKYFSINPYASFNIGAGLGIEVGGMFSYKFLSHKQNGYMLKLGYSFGTFLKWTNTDINIYKTDTNSTYKTYTLSESNKADLAPAILRHRFPLALFFPLENTSLQFFVGVNFDILVNRDKFCSTIKLEGDTSIIPCNKNIIRNKFSFSYSIGFRDFSKNNRATTVSFSPMFLGKLSDSSKKYLDQQGFTYGNTRNFGFYISVSREFGRFGKTRYENRFGDKKHVQSKEIPFELRLN